MKTRLKIKFRESQCMPGTGRLVLHITRHRLTRGITFDALIERDEWNESDQCLEIQPKASSRRKRELRTIRTRLKAELRTLHETIELLEARGDFSAQDVVSTFRERRKGLLFCDYVNQRVETLRQEGRFGTARAYQFAGLSLFRFLGEKDIPTIKLSNSLMKEFENYLLSRQSSRNTVSCYMRSLRAAYNSALRENKIIPGQRYEKPFAGVFTGNARTSKRALDEASLFQLAQVDLKAIPDSSNRPVELAYDLFLFSFYTQGMSFIDMVNLKKENIKPNRIEYKRSKTGQTIIIQMEECIRNIIAKYENRDSPYVFPILGKTGDSPLLRWKKTHSALQMYNMSLRKIADQAGIQKKLTSYVSRHSWASMASREGIPLATISRGMGHESEKTTRIYIAQDFTDVGRANRQILAHFEGRTSFRVRTEK